MGFAAVDALVRSPDADAADGAVDTVGLDRHGRPSGTSSRRGPSTLPPAGAPAASMASGPAICRPSSCVARCVPDGRRARADAATRGRRARRAGAARSERRAAAGDGARIPRVRCKRARGAERLHMHKNTVHYRLARAEELRDLAIGERRLEFEIALNLVHTLGDRLLPEHYLPGGNRSRELARDGCVATSAATSRSSDASISSTRPYDLDAAARSGRDLHVPAQG
jgi:PucR-like helix-turn-helix protein